MIRFSLRCVLRAIMQNMTVHADSAFLIISLIIGLGIFLKLRNKGRKIGFMKLQSSNKMKIQKFQAISRRKRLEKVIEPSQPSNIFYSNKNQISKRLLNFIFNQKKPEGIIKKANLPEGLKEKFDYCKFRIEGSNVILKGFTNSTNQVNRDNK